MGSGWDVRRERKSSLNRPTKIERIVNLANASKAKKIDKIIASFLRLKAKTSLSFYFIKHIIAHFHNILTQNRILGDKQGTSFTRKVPQCDFVRKES